MPAGTPERSAAETNRAYAAREQEQRANTAFERDHSDLCSATNLT
jgi:hypothetical protein